MSVCRLHAGRRRRVVLSTTVCSFDLDPACCMLFCCVILLHRCSGADFWVRVSLTGWCATARAIGPLCSCDIYCRRDDVVLRSLITFPVYDCLRAQTDFTFSAAELFVFTNNSKKTPVVWNNRCVLACLLDWVLGMLFDYILSYVFTHMTVLLWGAVNWFLCHCNFSFRLILISCVVVWWYLYFLLFTLVFVNMFVYMSVLYCKYGLKIEY